MKDVQDILTSEKEAEKLLKQARKKADKIVSKARSDALALVAKEKAAVDASMDKAFAEKQGELEHEQEKILKQAQTKANRMHSSVSKKQEKAVALLVKGVMEEK